jgi:hypothetical protein
MSMQQERSLVIAYLEIHENRISEPDFSNWLADAAIGNSQVPFVSRLAEGGCWESGISPGRSCRSELTRQRNRPV